MSTEPTCLRCSGAALAPEPSPADVAFFACPRCGRRFARHPSGALTERWLGPLSLALYGVQFAAQPQAEAARIAAQLRSQKDAGRCARIVEEIRLELAAPTQPVREIFQGMRGSEDDLRAFLRAVADALDAGK